MHDTWAISAVVHGAKDNVVGSAPNVARAGQIVVLRPHQVHGGRVVGNEPCEYVMAYVPERLLSELAQQAGMANASLPEHALDDAELVQRFAALVRGEARPLPALRLQGRTAAAPWDRLLTDLLKRYNECTQRPDAHCEVDGNRQQMKDALAYLHAHWDESVPLATLSEQAGMSQAHFCRSFAKVYGLPPHRYQTVLRLTRVKSMLTEGASISDAAVLAGFADQSHLGRQFKACYGSTPGQISSAVRSRSYTSSPRHAGA